MDLYKRLTAKSGYATIEQEIGSIHNSLTSTIDDSLVAKQEMPKGKACKGVISVYFRDDLARQAQEAEQYARAKRDGSWKSEWGKPFKARPAISYVFYPSMFFPSQLGSVAVYGKTLPTIYHTLCKSGMMFGHRILSLSLEFGIRPYVDVTLRM